MSNSFNTNQARKSRKSSKEYLDIFNKLHMLDINISDEDRARLQSIADTRGFVPTGTMRYGNNRNYERDRKVDQRKSQRMENKEELLNFLNELTV